VTERAGALGLVEQLVAKRNKAAVSNTGELYTPGIQRM
jgi:hypothetical protein